jgi:hypothetical protein
LEIALRRFDEADMTPFEAGYGVSATANLSDPRLIKRNTVPLWRAAAEVRLRELAV